jgi:D-alanyl-D-alanine carboxypeptidase
MIPIDYDSLQTVINATLIELGVTNSFVFLQTPQGKFNFSYGESKPCINTHFRIASNTKMMIGAVITQQAQECLLSFSDPVSKFIKIPFLSEWKETITISNLLQMRSGLYDYTQSPIISKSLNTNPTKHWKTKELLKIAFSQPPNAPPNTEYQYCNTNYLLLGLIIEKIDRKCLSESFQDRLFDPLKLKATSLPNSNKIPKPFTNGYIYVGSEYALTDIKYTINQQLAVRSGKLKPLDVTFQNPSYAIEAGGVISTANNMQRWIKNLTTGKLFNEEYYEKWLNSFLPENEHQDYGYGINKLKFGPNIWLFHGGEMPGYNSFVGHDLENDVTLVIWTNLPVSINNQVTANTVMLKILNQIYVYSPLMV